MEIIEHYENVVFKGEEGDDIFANIEIYHDGSFFIKSKTPFSNSERVIEDDIFGRHENNFISIPEPRYKTKITYSIGQTKECNILFGAILAIGPKHIKDIDNSEIIKLSCDINCNELFFENRYYESQKHDDLSPKKLDLEFENASISVSSIHCFKTGKRITTLTITSASHNTYHTMQNILHKTITFISFASKKVVKHYNCVITDKDGDEYKLFYKPAFFNKDAGFSYPYLFNYNLNNIQTRFEKWNAITEQVEPLIRLYFLPQLTTLDLVLKYLTYTQVAECLHRKLRKINDMTFVQRMDSLVNQSIYSNILESHLIKDLPDSFRNTRNYYTHYNDDKKSCAESEIGLFFLCLKLELIIDLFLMEEIGFDYEYFNEIKEYVIEDRLNRKKKLEAWTK